MAEAEVRGEEGRPDHVVHDLERLLGAEPDQRPEHGDKADDRCRRKDASRTASIETPQADRAGASRLQEQETGDQVARDDEEDVNPDEAASDRGEACVGTDHDEYGDRAESLDVAPQRLSTGQTGPSFRGLHRRAHSHLHRKAAGRSDRVRHTESGF